jgi:pimeloyl-ACP methyl ester carboxylesterase
VLIDGRTLAYDEVVPAIAADVKGTILLLTGLGSKRLGWYKQLDVFGRAYRTIALDHRDTGDSDAVTAGYTVADLADDAAALLAALGIARSHVVGISLGGFTALELAVRHPDQVAKLVLVSTSAGGSARVAASAEILALLAPDPSLEIGERAIRDYSRIMAAEFVAAHPEALDHAAENARYRPMSTEAYVRQLQATLAHDVVASLQQITAPTLVIHGDLDPLVPPANGTYLATHIQGARHVVYPGVGHIPIIERADDFNRDVLAFLAEDATMPADAAPSRATVPAADAPPSAQATGSPVATLATTAPARRGRRFLFFGRGRT